MGDETTLDVFREGLSPDVRSAAVVEVYSPHARLGGISRAQDGWFLGDDFGQVCRAVAQTGGEAAECVQAIPYEAVDPDPVSLGFVLGPLQGAEQASRSGDGDRDKPEASEEAGPLLVVDAFQVSEFFEDLGQSLLAVRGELDGLPYGVDDPSQDEFPSVPAPVSLQ